MCAGALDAIRNFTSASCHNTECERKTHFTLSDTNSNPTREIIITVIMRVLFTESSDAKTHSKARPWNVEDEKVMPGSFTG